MRRFVGFLFAIFALNIGMASAATFEWNSTNGLGGTFTEVCGPPQAGCFNGQISTWSGDFFIDTVGGGLAVPPPTSTAISFVGVLNGDSTPATLFFGNITNNFCHDTAGCAALAGPLGFLPWSSAPAGSTFEMEICNSTCTLSTNRIYLFVAANGGATSLVGFSGGTVLYGKEFGGECNTTPPASGLTCADFINSTSTTPLPATLPLLGAGFAGLWALRKVTRKGAAKSAS